MRDDIARHGMVLPGETVLVAVSGGPDSTALVHALHLLAPELECHLHLFHMDHALRGEESTGDAAYVLELATTLGVPVTIVRLEEGALPGPGLQAAARDLRYRELARVASRVGANRIALGHNLDDQAETVLMRFLRGTGSTGLSGIAPVRGPYVRPILSVSRLDIEAYCREQGLLPRLDSSNLKTVYLRNRVRLELMPLLEKDYNPNLRATLSRMSELFREESCLLDSLAEAALARWGGLTTRSLRAEPPALARRMVRLAAGTELDYQAVEQVLSLPSEGTQEVHLAGGLRAVAEYGHIRFERSWAGSPDQLFVPLQVPGETVIANLGLLFSVSAAPVAPRETSKEWVAFDMARLQGPLAVRFRQPGDRLYPVGMEGSRKLQDIFVDAKIPARQRDRIPLLVAGKDVLWAIGLRLDRRFLAGPETGESLVVQVLSYP